MLRNIAFALMLPGVVGCVDLTTPDDDDMSPLVGAVGRLDDWSRYTLEVYKDFDALEILKNENPDRPVADVYCGAEEEPSYKLSMKNIYIHMKDYIDTTLGGGTQKTFGEYLKNKLAELGCRADFMPYADFTDNMGGNLSEDDSRSNRETVEWVVGRTADYLRARPILMGVIGVVSAGGLLVALPFVGGGFGLYLCPLSDAVLCPDDPGAPGVPQDGKDDR